MTAVKRLRRKAAAAAPSASSDLQRDLLHALRDAKQRDARRRYELAQALRLWRSLRRRNGAGKGSRWLPNDAIGRIRNALERRAAVAQHVSEWPTLAQERERAEAVITHAKALAEATRTTSSRMAAALGAEYLRLHALDARLRTPAPADLDLMAAVYARVLKKIPPPSRAPAAWTVVAAIAPECERAGIAVSRAAGSVFRSVVEAAFVWADVRNQRKGADRRPDVAPAIRGYVARRSESGARGKREGI